MRRLLPVAVLVGILPAASRADDVLQRELEADAVLRALVDELERNVAGLKLADLARPYFIEYAVSDSANAWVAGCFGALTDRQEGRDRSLRVDVRVGSYELDNTNFDGYGYWGFGGGSLEADLPLEDDYAALRRAIWWRTDREYKRAAEAFVRKQAFMAGKLIEDKPPDFSREEPVVHLEPRQELRVDLAALEELATALSAVTREFADLRDCAVGVSASRFNRYLVNSEGTRLRTAGSHYSVSLWATVQAEDGMELSDSFSVHVRRFDELPPLAELSARCRALVERLLAVKAAPRLTAGYAGPVLFEPPAAAVLFGYHFADRFAGGQRPVGSSSSPDDFAHKLGRRILPRFIDVVDDPTLERIGDVPVMGHYRFDDQGVRAQRVVLVENGRLKALLMSRNPSKEFSNSNGHGRGSYGADPEPGCLIVSADPAAGAAELREELIETCRDEGLEYGLRIVALRGSQPLVLYKVYPDGREELVRGAQIARIDLKDFKRMLAAGGEPYVRNTSSAGGQTLVVPALLFEELDVSKIDRDFDRPPILPAPLARPVAGGL